MIKYPTNILLCIIAYILVSKVKKSPSLPEIKRISLSIRETYSSDAFYGHLLYTLKIVCIGLLISLIIGFLIALSCSLNSIINGLLMPIINAIKNIPSISLFPLFIVLMGIDDKPRIVIIIWNSLYPIISRTMTGLMSTDKEVIEAAQNCGASKWQVYKYIRIPLAITSLLEGLKISAGNGFIAIVVAEMLGATKGLGYMILWSANSFNYSVMYVYILTIAIVGLLINVMIDALIKLVERIIYS